MTLTPALTKLESLRCPAKGCGEKFTQTHILQEFCSPVCSNRERGRRHREKRKRELKELERLRKLTEEKKR